MLLLLEPGAEGSRALLARVVPPPQRDRLQGNPRAHQRDYGDHQQDGLPRRYQPLAAGVFVAPCPYAYRYGWDEETTLRFASQLITCCA
jgi:hypothetical protein